MTTDDLHRIVILPIRPEDQDETKSLILKGLGEHWGFIDYSKNPDLEDIPTTYANATFLVARLDGRLIGTGAFITPTEGIAQVVRMSVVSDLRRRGIGRMIVEQLRKRAKEVGCQHMVLETTETWDDVIRFYKHLGFRITHYHEACVFFVQNLDA